MNNNSDAEHRISLFPAVIIGLGGTGRRVCGRLKKLMLDAFGDIPPHVRLLAIDTKKADEADPEIAQLSDAEKLTLRLDNPPQYLERLPVWAPWFPTGDVGRSLKHHLLIADQHGAGAVRPIGKLLLEANWRVVHAGIRRATEQVHRNIRDYNNNGPARATFERMGLGNFDSGERDNVLYLIVGNLVSGTGSGGFLELAYIAAAVAAGQSAGGKVFGFLTLPPHTDSREHLHNASAALRELQHYMSPHVWDVPSKQYRIESPASREILMNHHDLVRRAPYEVVHLARPVDSSSDAVNALSHQTAEFLFDFTCTDLGSALHGEYVNFNSQANAIGERPIFSSYGTWRAEDHTRAAARLSRAMIGDFIADDISGKSNADDADSHKTWKADVVDTTLEKVRTAWGLPSADRVNLLTAEDDFRKSCQSLLDRVKNEVSRNPFRIGSVTVPSLGPEAVREALLKDNFLTANINVPGMLLQHLSNRMAPHLEGLNRAFEDALPSLVTRSFRELCSRLNAIYLAGGSVRQMIDICKALQVELESLSSKISNIEHSARQDFSFDSLLRVLQEYVARRVDQWTSSGVNMFRENLRQQVATYIDKRTALTAIRLINGFENPTARTITEDIHGISFQPAAGLRVGLEKLIATLERIQAQFVSVSSVFESRVSLRMTRNAAVQETLRRTYRTSCEKVVEEYSAVRHALLTEIARTDSFFALLDVPQAELESCIERIATKYVPELSAEEFGTWWNSRKVAFDREMLLNLSSLRFDEMRAQQEGSGLKMIVALRCRAGEDQEPRVTLSGIADKLVPVGRVNDNSVSLMVSHGLSALSWIQGFDVLSNSYRQLDESQLAVVHTVADPIQLRPIATGINEGLMFYVAACALDWIRPSAKGAHYVYAMNEDLDEAVSEYRYAEVVDADSPAGPIRNIFVPLRAADAHPPGPEPPIMMANDGRRAVAGSIYQHLRWRLEHRITPADVNGAYRRKRTMTVFKLIRLFLWQLESSRDESHHLTQAKIRTSGEHLASWVRSVFGGMDRADEQAALAELRQEKGESDATALLASYRSQLLQHEDRSAEPQRTTAAAPSRTVVGLTPEVKQFFVDEKIPVVVRAAIVDGLNQTGLTGAIEAAERNNLTETQTERLLAVLMGV